MPSQYTIGGCQVHFPHQAYGVQLSFMSKVIAALEGGHNALLEAPTGGSRQLQGRTWLQVPSSLPSLHARCCLSIDFARLHLVCQIHFSLLHLLLTRDSFCTLQAPARRCRCCARRWPGRYDWRLVITYLTGMASGWLGISRGSCGCCLLSLVCTTRLLLLRRLQHSLVHSAPAYFPFATGPRKAAH